MDIERCEKMRRIYVDPIRLENSATKIDQDAQEYQKDFTRLFEEIETMKTAWQGKDNVAFTNQIRNYETDFRQVQILCQQYAEFLRTSARAYRETQEELAAQALRL